VSAKMICHFLIETLLEDHPDLNRSPGGSAW